LIRRAVAAVAVAVMAISVLAAVSTARTAAAVPSAATHVLVVGDSVAAGWTLQSAQVAWPARLADRLWGENHSRITVEAAGGRCLVAPGCAGTPIAQVWATEVLGASPTPSTVILAAGENDVSRVSADVIEAAIAQLVDEADAAGVRVLVATIPPQESSRWTSWWGWGPTMLQVNAWIRATYGNNVIDFHAALVDTNGWMRPVCESGDGVHPNRYGHVDLSDSVPLGRIQ